MANQCLVTKLKAAIENSSLLKLGEIQLTSVKVDTPSESSQWCTLGKLSPVKAIIKSGNARFATSYNGVYNLTEADFSKQLNYHLSNEESEISLISKYDIVPFGTPDVHGVTFNCCKVNIEQFAYSGADNICDFAGVTGDISRIKGTNGDNGLAYFRYTANMINETGSFAELVANNPNIKSLYFSVPDALISKFAIEDFSTDNLCKLPLTSVTVQKCPLTGSVANLGKLTNVSSFSIGTTSITGDIVDMVKMFRASGKTAGSVSWSWMGSNTGITVNGTKPDNASNNTITWTANQITVTIGTNDPIIIEK